MDAQQILDMLLNSGKELVEKGKTLAESELNLPTDPAERQQMLDGAGKGALAASAVALLLGTQAGRKLTGAGLKLGSLAAIGGVAYNAYQKWQSEQGAPSADSGKPITALTGAESNQRSKVLLTALLAAAQADGTVDDNEKAIIEQQIQKLNLTDAGSLLADVLKNPVNAETVAKSADSPATAAEIYVISRTILDGSNEQERNYLAQLTQALGLTPELVAELESHLKA